MRERWSRYWFAPGGRLALAIVRVGVALSMLWTIGGILTRGSPALLPAAPGALYHPVGLWALLGGTPPATATVHVLAALAVIALVLMLAGARTRASTAVAFVAAHLVVTLDASFAPTWSHGNNLPMLAHLALLGARAGDTFSVDAWWRRRHGLAPLVADRAYQRPLRLAQLFVAMMFLSALAIKLYAAGGTLRWALSDNLRHHLLVRFDYIGVPRTAAADWLLAAPWRYQAAALANLVSQLMPIVACLVPRRAWLRLVCGGFFVAETLALGVVMDLWNLHWLPLAVVFVDGDRFLGTREAPSPTRLPAPGRFVRILLPVLVVYELTLSFVPPLDQWLRTYPFSSFPMFARLRAKRPYSEHQSYELLGGAYELLPEGSATRATAAAVARHRTHRDAHRVRDPELLRRRLGAALADATGASVVRLHLAVFQAPAVPEPARLERHLVGILGELDRAGGYRTLLGSVVVRDADGLHVTLRPVGVSGAPLRYLAYVDESPIARPLLARANGDRVDLEEPGGTNAIIVAVLATASGGEEAFVIGAAPPRRAR